MSNDDRQELEELLHEVWLLKTRIKALDVIYEEKRKRVQKLMDRSGLKKFSCTVGDELCTAAVVMRTLFPPPTGLGLLNEVPDKEAFCQLVLERCNLNKATVMALRGIGVPILDFVSKKQVRTLQVRCGDLPEALAEANREYYEDLAVLLGKFRGLGEVPEPVFPRPVETVEESDVS